MSREEVAFLEKLQKVGQERGEDADDKVLEASLIEGGGVVPFR